MKRNAKCFFLTPIDRCRESLRRYASSGTEKTCTGRMSYHNASVVIGDVEGADRRMHADDFPHDDPRWPTQCECGYVFTDDDKWQHNVEQLFSRSDGGSPVTLHEAPPGAIWDATWYPKKGPDGRSLCVKLPNGMEWLMDSASSDGGYWTRTGSPPNLTVRPSIWINRNLGNDWHGFLTDGELKEC